jgi:hypothetical protein
MLVYGTRSKLLAKELVTDKCPNCGTQNSTEIHVFQKWAHVFWIPFFPIGKVAASECGHCKQVLKEKEMTSSMQTVLQDVKSRSKTPIWTFSGLALLAVLIVVGVINDKKKDEKIAKLILAPLAGDVFEMKTPESQYTLYKVAAIQGDSVMIRPNNMETNKPSGLTKIKAQGDAGYAEETFSVSKAELKSWFDKGEIIDIERK